MQKHIIVRDTLIYSGASYIVIIVGFFVSVFSKRFFGVSGAGYWALLTVVTTYGMYIGLGVQNALIREVPQSIGAKKMEKAKEIENVTYSFLLIAGLTGTVVIWLLSFFLFTDPVLKTGMKIIAVLVFVTHLYNLILNILRARKQISILSRVVVLNILLVAMFALPGAYFLNVNGFAAGVVISTALSFFFAKRWADIRFSLSFDWDQIWHLIKIGVAMLLVSILSRTFLNVDKIMIGKMLGIEQLGFYTIGIMAIQQVSTLPRFFNIVIFPHIQEKYGATKDVLDIKNVVMKSTYFISRLAPILIGTIIFITQPVVFIVLPEFKDGLGIMKILVIGYYFIAINQMSSTLIYTIDKQRSLIPLYGIMVVVCIGLNYLFIIKGLGITGVALGTSISYFLFFLVVFTFASRHILEWYKIVRLYFEIMIFYFYFLVNILWIDAIVNFPGAILTSFSKISCFLLVSIPVLISVQRRERIFSIIYEAFKSKSFSSRAGDGVVAK
jgi:O-antigen/teichoic acid export membrane protein